MFYRPVFCCNCGEKIVREEWRLWTSRRFCALCETEHKGIDILPRVAAAVAVLLSVAAFASYLRRPASVNSGDTAFKSTQVPRSLKAPSSYSPANVSAPPNSANDPLNNNSAVSAKSQINEQPQREKRTSDEAVFFCGAITKKGTPCTRRVKTKGSFCWQHAKSGQVAPARF